MTPRARQYKPMTSAMGNQRLLLAVAAVVVAVVLWVYDLAGHIHYSSLICTALVAFAARELYQERQLAKTELFFTSKKEMRYRRWALRNIALVPLALLAFTANYRALGTLLLLTSLMYGVGYGLWVSRRKSRERDKERQRLTDHARAATQTRQAQ